jgi:hypothetical protein
MWGPDRSVVYPGVAMTPEKINRYAMWGTIAILAIAAVVFAARWTPGSSDGQNPEVGIAQTDLSDTSLGTGIAPVAEPVGSSDGAPTTQPPPSVVLDAHIEAAIDASPNPTDVTGPSTTNAPTTTGTTRPQTQPATTTLPPAPATTIPTTTTLPIATSTTLAPTTTTMPTATTTTAPATTTTSTIPSDLSALFVVRFDARPEGDEDDWSIDLAVTVSGTSGGSYRAQVYISWSGGTSGSTVLTTGGSGNATATIGTFNSDAVTVTITNVQASNWIYRPGLNQASTSLNIQAPDG